MKSSPLGSTHLKQLVGLAGTLACMAASPCFAQDVTRPGDPVVASSTNYPSAESPDRALDNVGSTKYLNFDKFFTGFTVTPSGTGIVRSLTIVTANDAPERDPASYILDGSDDGINFITIASGNFNAPTARYAIDQQSFANATQYAQYRITFPTVRTSTSANSMQVAEVQFNTNVNVIIPGDAFSTTYSSGASSSANETAANLFDNRLGTKLGVAGGSLGPTIVNVTPGAGASVVTGVEVYGGADDQAFGGRTPSTFTLSGSNDGVSYSDIFTTPLIQVTQNYQGQQFSFANAVSYTRYRITFGASSAAFMQVGEVRLMGTVSNAPPANDACATAQTIVAGATSGSNLNATGTDTTACGTNDSFDVWYSYHANSAGPVEVDTIGAGELDTTLAILDGCGGPVLGCDDNSHGSKSRVRFTAVAGHNYKIRVAGVNDSTGGFTLNLNTSPVSHSDRSVALACNFNGMVHDGEANDPDNLNGYRSLSDRGMRITGTVGSLEVGLEGLTGIPYSVISTGRTLDIVQLGDRNQVDSFGHQFDFDADGDNIGVQPTWLPDTNQTIAQTTDLSSLSAALGADTQIGVLYNATNGGNSFDLTLNFTSGDPVTVRLNAPDWYGEQNPTPPGTGVEAQAMLGTFFAAQSEDLGEEGVNLNIIEAIISTSSLSSAGFDVMGRAISSMTFSNAASANADIGIYAATVRDSVGACAPDFNHDGIVDFFDYLDFVQAFSANDPTADFNHDSIIDFFDYLDFVQAFAAGC